MKYELRLSSEAQKKFLILQKRFLGEAQESGYLVLV